MKYNILKRAIQVKEYKPEESGSYVTLALLSYRNEIFSDTIFLPIGETPSSETAVLRKAVDQFKQDERYKAYIDTLNVNQVIVDTDGVSNNQLTKEYNTINDLSKLRYLENTYPEPKPQDFTNGKITRYFAKYLNQTNIFIELDYGDFLALQTQEPTVHFEAYDFFSFDWKINGTREEIFDENTVTLKKYNKAFPGFFAFHNEGEYKAGPYYITVYDEIRNLYTTGRELAYRDTYSDYSGYYHLGYLDLELNVLLSRKNNAFEDKEILIEVTTYQPEPFDPTVEIPIKEVKDTIRNLIKDNEIFLDSLNVEFNLAEESVRREVIGLQNELEKSITNTLKGTDFEQVVECSKTAFKDLMKAVEIDASNNDSTGTAQAKAQAKVQETFAEKCSGKAGEKISENIKDKSVRIGVEKKIKDLKPPKVKIPNVPQPHGEGQDHAYELGF